MPQQIGLFPTELPEGFVYQPEFISLAEEATLVSGLRQLRFHPFQYQGYTAKRNVIEYGYEYDYSVNKTSSAPAIPEFLEWLRRRAAEFARVHSDELIECVVHEYRPGAPIGWHRDVPQFEIVTGISLLNACRMRFRPYQRKGRILSIELEPRSAYIMRGEARWKYQHSIPPVESLRYSITLRTLRKKRLRSAA
jgi:alkylated DNA repair dioxygenase AlkB